MGAERQRHRPVPQAKPFQPSTDECPDGRRTPRSRPRRAGVRPSNLRFQAGTPGTSTSFSESNSPLRGAKERHCRIHEVGVTSAAGSAGCPLLVLVSGSPKQQRRPRGRVGDRADADRRSRRLLLVVHSSSRTSGPAVVAPARVVAAVAGADAVVVVAAVSVVARCPSLSTRCSSSS